MVVAAGPQSQVLTLEAATGAVQVAMEVAALLQGRSVTVPSFALAEPPKPWEET